MPEIRLPAEPDKINVQYVPHIKKSDCAVVVSPELLQQTAKIQKIGQRSSMVHSLLASCGLLAGMHPILPSKITNADLRVFHSEDYVNFLEQPDDYAEEDFGCGYDCPVIEDMGEFGRTIAAGSIAAAETLISGRAKLAINWHGGWHHAKRDSASGFCYVNDIVVAIHRLQAGGFSRVMYVDLDVHHGDGVEEAFSCTNRVLTLSIHRQEPGFFPGTGALQDVGFGRGRYYSVNVPLKEGVDDRMFIDVFTRIFSRAAERFGPEVVVVQCGADGLVGDPLGGFNLTEKALSVCVQQIAALGVPVLLLGGGGYNPANVARCWVRITADLTGSTIPVEIPDTDPFFLAYGPDYEIYVSPGCIRNANRPSDVENLVLSIERNLDLLAAS